MFADGSRSNQVAKWVYYVFVVVGTVITVTALTAEIWWYATNY